MPIKAEQKASNTQNTRIEVFVVDMDWRSRPCPAWVEELRWHTPNNGQDWWAFSGPPTRGHSGQWGMCLVRLPNGNILDGSITKEDADCLANACVETA